MSPNVTMDNLAVMIKTGFDEVGGRFDSVEGRLDRVEGRLDNLERGQEETNGRLTALEHGQEDIKLRLDYTAHRFELDDLGRRVKVLERKAGVN